MKIDGLAHVLQLQNGPTRARPVTRSSAPTGGVSLSGTASWIQEMQAEADEPAGVRMDLVNEMKAAIANGTLEESVDMDKVLDGLMAEL